MALNSYTNIKTAIATLLNRDDLTAAVPDWITLAEAQMQRRFVSRMREGKPYPRRLVVPAADLTIADAAEYVDVPDDFAGAISLVLPGSPQIVLDYLDNEAFQAEKSANRWTGAPKYYTVTGDQFQIYPVADQAYTGKLTYLGRFEALSNSVATNWILTDYPDAYLYGAAVQSAPYLKDDNRLVTWGSLFTAALDDICNADPKPSNKVTLRVDPAMTRYGNRAPYTTASTT